MSEPGAVSHAHDGASREISKQEVLDAARPLSPIAEMLIEGLTDTEAQRFLDTILTA